MSTLGLMSYLFIYGVLFVIVPFVAIVFVMTCIKFFKSEEHEEDEILTKCQNMAKGEQ
ncbi:hypothetical protein JK628_07470 [Shewanella sp. KX20019]|uniref:hypothetical protein n=1 Tax=Shewanella sp. KX20019 TaxID=2803864 RepID=UPI0019265DB0|nr:hypothetical protein [Shewanella sp. KX20019]QQX81669.1 hypothetical protein JK628_07470 [Shewanella sp. KX20019]